ncbi:ABC transporter ATP-binding protein [Acetatifactor aquisgranensis]|uniref:ABC transporter ATP-binding protein n=1 Tax=Acetatifactor aquisgranensis TaxID=2941233 RepID=UPI00203CD2A6|nr:ABC transporter ATP-binding protein [Acetatifactor aquisgranensis]
MKKQLSNQLWLLAFCMKTSPKLMVFNLFIPVEQSVFVFFEYTIWIGYNLNAVENGAPFSQVALLTLGVFLAYLVHQLVDSVYYQWAFERLKPILTFQLRRQIYEKAKSMDLSCYDDPEFYNDFVLSTTQADQCIERFMNDGRDFVSTLTVCILYFSYLLSMDTAGLILALACSLLRLWAGKAYFRLQEKARLEKLPLERERDYQHRLFYLHDYAKELRLHPEMSRLALGDFDRCNARMNAVNRKYGPRLCFLGFVQAYLPKYFMLYAVYLPFLLYRAMIRQSISLSLVVILLAAVRRMIGRSGDLVKCIPGFAYNGAFIEKIRRFLFFEPKIVSGEKEVEGGFRSLALSHVSFSYGGGRDTLRDIDLEIRKGQKVALVGYNGAGKTTLVKLLMRLYDPDSGAILRNGQDIRDLRLSDYRKGIGAVFQDYKIYAATLRENVVMDLCTGEKRETYEVERALDRAKFDISERKLKYQIETPLTTEFEKDGVNLSGGESQKVAIARTLYRGHELIIMDEPSSALDPASEYRLNQELHRISEDKTVIFISHRLATARDADCIYMMKEGRIVEKGTHEQLLALGGEYSRMWELQAGAYIFGD